MVIPDWSRYLVRPEIIPLIIRSPYQSSSFTDSQFEADSLSSEKLSIGELVIGGAGNLNGVLSVLDNQALERVRLDNSGITVTNGRIVVQDSSNQAVIDSLGLNSVTSFQFDGIFVPATQNVVNTLVDRSPSSALTFTLVREARVMILATALFGEFGWTTVSPSDGQLRVNIDGVDYQPYATFNGVRGSAGNIVGLLVTVTTHLIQTLAAGTHTIKLRIFHAGNGLGVDISNSQLSYLVLGK